MSVDLNGNATSSEAKAIARIESKIDSICSDITLLRERMAGHEVGATAHRVAMDRALSAEWPQMRTDIGTIKADMAGLKVKVGLVSGAFGAVGGVLSALLAHLKGQ